jgi:NAD(P)-dependent dehydrogenase (short-subunit alcohol dehydrogenase family)
MPNSRFDLTGRVALIVGAGSPGGIGFAAARQIAACGGSVAIADRSVAEAEALIAELPDPKLASVHQVDVADRASVDAMVAAVKDRHGGLDCAVNAAGILSMERFLDVTDGEWQRCLDVNLTGCLLVGQAAARVMKDQGRGGSIVLVSSNAGRVPRLATVSYGVAKAAVIQLVHCMALELGPLSIRANALCPGSTATSMMVNQAGGDQSKLDGVLKGSVEQWRTGIPLGRFAEPDDQGAVIAFLASDAARHITGQAICVDGGQTFF